MEQGEEKGCIEPTCRRVLIRHLRQVDTAEVGGSEGVATPVSLALLDISNDLDSMKAEYEVVVGDWNVRNPGGRPSNTAAGRRNTEVVRRFARDRELVEPLKARLGRDEVELDTCSNGEHSSWIDYYIVSKKLEDRGRGW